MDFSLTLNGTTYAFSPETNTFTSTTGDTVVTYTVPSTVAPTVVDVTQGEEIQIDETDATTDGA